MVKILIADDHPVVRERLKQLLIEEFASATFTLADDTESLLEQALNHEWDIIISDLIMPGGGGLYAVKRIKEVKPAAKVIIISIYPEEQYSTRAIQQGASAFLNKNNVDTELVDTVKQLLKTKVGKTI